MSWKSQHITHVTTNWSFIKWNTKTKNTGMRKMGWGVGRKEIWEQGPSWGPQPSHVVWKSCKGKNNKHPSSLILLPPLFFLFPFFPLFLPLSLSSVFTGCPQCANNGLLPGVRHKKNKGCPDRPQAEGRSRYPVWHESCDKVVPVCCRHPCREGHH